MASRQEIKKEGACSKALKSEECKEDWDFGEIKLEAVPFGKNRSEQDGSRTFNDQRSHWWCEERLPNPEVSGERLRAEGGVCLFEEVARPEKLEQDFQEPGPKVSEPRQTEQQGERKARPAYKGAVGCFLGQTGQTERVRDVWVDADNALPDTRKAAVYRAWIPGERTRTEGGATNKPPHSCQRRRVWPSVPDSGVCSPAEGKRRESVLKAKTTCTGRVAGGAAAGTRKEASLRASEVRTEDARHACVLEVGAVCQSAPTLQGYEGVFHVRQDRRRARGQHRHAPVLLTGECPDHTQAKRFWQGPSGLPKQRHRSKGSTKLIQKREGNVCNPLELPPTYWLWRAAAPASRLEAHAPFRHCTKDPGLSRQKPGILKA